MHWLAGPPRLKADSGLGITTNYRLDVSDRGQFRDANDLMAYGQLQVTRSATQGDTGHYVSGLGYVDGTSKVYITINFIQILLLVFVLIQIK